LLMFYLRFINHNNDLIILTQPQYRFDYINYFN
jgi:hypothetical protein